MLSRHPAEDMTPVLVLMLRYQITTEAYNQTELVFEAGQNAPGLGPGLCETVTILWRPLLHAC